MSRDRDRLLYRPKFFLNHSSTFFASWLRLLNLGSLRVQNYLYAAGSHFDLVILFSNVHMLPLFFRLFTLVHLLIDDSVEGQYNRSDRWERQIERGRERERERERERIREIRANDRTWWWWFWYLKLVNWLLPVLVRGNQRVILMKGKSRASLGFMTWAIFIWAKVFLKWIKLISLILWIHLWLLCYISQNAYRREMEYLLASKIIVWVSCSIITRYQTCVFWH